VLVRVLVLGRARVIGKGCVGCVGWGVGEGVRRGKGV